MLSDLSPSTSEWNRYRDVITELWSHMTLKEVRNHMEIHHNFSAR